MSYTVIGVCSTCGGLVSVPSVWSGLVPPVPQCGVCGALATLHLPKVKTTPIKYFTSSRPTGVGPTQVIQKGVK